MKRLLPILLIILFTTTHSEAQSSRPVGDGDKIVKLYPNPATSNFITFELQKTNERNLSIQIYNFLGKKMYEGQNVAAKLTVDLSDFNRGVYIYHVSDQSGKLVESGKFQVSR